MSGADKDWGPWIEHDGKGCPVPIGVFIRAKLERLPGHFVLWSGFVTPDMLSWDWRNWCKPEPGGRRWVMALRGYQVRKPRGMTILEGLLENLPAPALPLREGLDA